MNVTLYADGSGTRQGNPGGWAAIVLVGEDVAEYSGSYADATNQTMELASVLHGLQVVPAGADVEVITDSECAIRWMTGVYKRRDPRIMSLGDRIENLIKARNLTVRYTHVRGHTGVIWNERADMLAKLAREQRTTEIRLLAERAPA